MEYVKLNNGVEMPKLGYGVFQVEPDIAERCVSDALEVGYRLIDTAQAYANEEGVGAAIKKSGIPRDEIFVTSKIWVANANYERAKKSIDESLEKLGGDYIDLMLLHQAYGDYHGAYRAMEEAYKAGKIRAIGVSNFYPTRLIDLVAFAEVKPVVDQIETHPFRQQREAHENMVRLGVQHEAWAPFAEGANGIFTNPVLTEIGEKYGKSAGQVVLRALMQQGVVVIPKSTHKERMAENLDVFDFTLDNDDMEKFATLEDPSFARIFDHTSTQTVDWLLNQFVKKEQLNGGSLF